jgi:glycosyltransferase involved in cell wall biosynthesis
MSCQKPVIASAVGINSSIVKNGENGFLVKSLDGWFEAFEKLYVDRELREKTSKDNFLKIENSFNHIKNCKVYLKLIKNNF